MSITLVQTAQGGYGYVNSFTQAMGSPVTAGSTLIAAITAGDGDTVSSFVDNNGNTWRFIASDTNAGQRETLLYYAYNCNSGSTTLTVTWTSGQFNDANVIVREYSGLTMTDPLDVSAHANDGGASLTTHPCGTTAATSQGLELVVAVAGCPDSQDPTWSAPSGFGNLATQKGFDLFTYGAMADNVVTVSGAQTAAFTTVDTAIGQGVIATFKGIVSGTGNSDFFLVL